MIVGGLLLQEILGQTDGVGAKSPIFDQFSLLRLNRITSSDKVQLLTVTGSSLRAFQ